MVRSPKWPLLLFILDPTLQTRWVQQKYRYVCWGYHVLTYADAAILQAFLCEQFGMLSPKPTQYATSEMVEVEENGEIIER